MPVVQKEATSNKELLLALRKKTDQEMQEVESYYQKARTGNQEEKQKYQELYVNAARELFEKTADKMKDFLAKLYKTAEAELGKPPCKYAVIGLGSMALKQMTPYSDLEFAILTENEDYKHSSNPKVREYFKNLSHLVNFKMINLGESIIPTSKYGLDMSHLVHVAVNFDLGGKTPLGRIGGDKPYELIKTVDWMLHYVRNEGDKASNIDKNLPYILENVCYVYGDEKLVETYKGKVTEFLHDKNKDDSQGRLNCEIRAVKLLEEGAVEISYLQPLSDLKPKKILFKGDLDKLKPNLSEAEGRLFDVKQEIYRLPDRMVYNLGLYYGIEGNSAWNTVDKLAEQEIISREAALNLKNAITFATTLRLKTYSHYKTQKEDMSIFVIPAETESKLKEQAKQIFHLSEGDLGEQGGLFQYFYTALHLYEKLEEFCKSDNASRKSFFQDTKFYVDNSINKGLIHYRLAQYTEAQNNLEQALNKTENQNNFQINHILGIIYNSFGDVPKAIKQFEHCRTIDKLNTPLSLLNLGIVYAANGQYDKAVEYLKDSLNSIYNKSNSNIAMTYYNFGMVNLVQGYKGNAIQYLEKSLEIRKSLYNDKFHPHIAMSFYGLGELFQACREYDKAIEYHTISLNMRNCIYHEERHLDIAASFNALGIIYKLKKNYPKAIEYFDKSLSMQRVVYNNSSHLDIAKTLNNLGNLYYDDKKYEIAIEYHTQSLEMKRTLYNKNLIHSDIAISLNNLANALRVIGHNEEASKHLKESLEIQRSLCNDKPNPDIDNTLYWIKEVEKLAAAVSVLDHVPFINTSLLANELLTTSAISTSVNMDDINVTLLADIDLSKTNQDLPSP